MTSAMWRQALRRFPLPDVSHSTRGCCPLHVSPIIPVIALFSNATRDAQRNALIAVPRTTARTCRHAGSYLHAVSSGKVTLWYQIWHRDVCHQTECTQFRRAQIVDLPVTLHLQQRRERRGRRRAGEASALGMSLGLLTVGSSLAAAQAEEPCESDSTAPCTLHVCCIYILRVFCAYVACMLQLSLEQKSRASRCRPIRMSHTCLPRLRASPHVMLHVMPHVRCICVACILQHTCSIHAAYAACALHVFCLAGAHMLHAYCTCVAQHILHMCCLFHICCMYVVGQVRAHSGICFRVHVCCTCFVCPQTAAHYSEALKDFMEQRFLVSRAQLKASTFHHKNQSAKHTIIVPTAVSSESSKYREQGSVKFLANFRR